MTGRREQRAPSGFARRAAWPLYALALAVSLLTLELRLELLSTMGSDRPILGLFLLPIILSAFAGGAGPGLTATVVVALASLYFVIPPTRSLSIAQSVDAVQWVILLATGVLVSVLSEAMHRSRRRTEAALRAQSETEERYRMVVENQTDLIARFTPDGTLTFVNDVVCRLAGKTRAELLGARWHIGTVPNDLPAVFEQLQSLAPDHPVVAIENRMVTPDGRIAWMHFVNRGFFDSAGRLTEIQAVGRDITERKQVEEALRRSEERFNLAMRGANDGLWDWDLKTGAAYYSPRWKAMLGYADDELGDQPDAWLRLIHPDDLPRALAVLRGQVEAGSESFEIEFRMRHKDGHEVDILSRGFQLLDAAGEVVRMVGTHINITERKQLQARLQSALSLMQATLESTTDGILVVDRNGRFAAHNRRFAEMWRLPAALLERGDDDEALQAVLEQLNEPERFIEKVRQLYKGPEANSFDVLHFKDGRVFERASQPQRVGAEIVGRVWSFRNVTERERSERRLRESEERYRLALDAAELGTWRYDITTGTIHLDARGQSHSGSPTSGVSMADFMARIHPEDLGRLEQASRAALNPDGDGRFVTEYRVIHPDGNVRWLALEARLAFSGDGTGRHPVASVGVSRDITARKQAEQQMQLQAAALESAANGIVITDRSGTIQWVNAAFTKLTGYSAAEVVGQNPRVLRSGRHDVAFYRTLWETIAAGRVWKGELVNRRKDGSLYTEAMTITPVHTDGETTHFIAIKDDVSERKQLTDQLHLAQKMEALGTLAGGVAHDFNNILGAIIGNVELAAQDVGPGHPALESLDEIRKASRRAKELVQRILAFSRQQPRARSVIALRPVIEEATKFLRASLPAGVALATTYADDTPAVIADPTQIEQVLLNLCTNAWQALPELVGRIDIRLDGVTASAADTSLATGRWARLTVTDNGVGMDGTTLDRVFEPFFSTKSPGQGTGLGLSVVHGIVEAHGGVIDVQSEPGKGTTFKIYFPAASTPAASVAAETILHPRPAPAPGLHVLYLDDEEALVFLVARTLERLGYRVSGYTRWETALAALRTDAAQFDLVVTDLNMPDGSGLDLARELHRLRPALPVLLVSGYISDELHAQAVHAGVRQLIYKPNTVDELCEAVQRLTRPTT